MRTFGTQNKQRQVVDAKRLRSKSMLNQSMKKRSFIKIILVVLFSCMLALSIVHAGNDKNKEKQGKPDKEHVKKDHKQKDKAMNDSDDDRDHDDDEGHKKDRGHKGKNEHDDDDGSKGLEKQKQKKSERERKELGKGSEQGQAAREEHSRKWWKFWE